MRQESQSDGNPNSEIAAEPNEQTVLYPLITVDIQKEGFQMKFTIDHFDTPIVDDIFDNPAILLDSSVDGQSTASLPDMFVTYKKNDRNISIPVSKESTARELLRQARLRLETEYFAAHDIVLRENEHIERLKNKMTGCTKGSLEYLELKRLLNESEWQLTKSKAEKERIHPFISKKSNSYIERLSSGGINNNEQ